MRPRIRVGREPRHNIINGGKRTPVGLMARSPGGGKASPAGVRSPPLRGVASQGRMALRGKARGWREGVFLGGTHSVRPRLRAGRRPRHNIINGGKRTPGGLMARSPGGGKAFPAGVRSPPLRGVGQPGSDGLAGKTRG